MFIFVYVYIVKEQKSVEVHELFSIILLKRNNSFVKNYRNGAANEGAAGNIPQAGRPNDVCYHI